MIIFNVKLEIIIKVFLKLLLKDDNGILVQRYDKFVNLARVSASFANVDKLLNAFRSYEILVG